jgi:hypothetical protein
MALEFPPYFPSVFMAPVVAARSRAEREFRDELAVGKNRGKAAALKYIVTVIAAFGQQACAAGRSGAIPLKSIEPYIDDFERRASLHAYYDLSLNEWWPSWESFRDEETAHRRWSAEWQALLTDLQRAANSVITGPPPATGLGNEPQAELLSDARASRRRAVVEPILKARGLTRSGLATEAGVDPSVVYDYLKGRGSLYPSSRIALAKALGITESDLPD